MKAILDYDVENSYGRSFSELTITWDNGDVEVHQDSGEPEDNTFGRDWSWVFDALQRAYDDGVAKGRKG